MLLLTSLDFSHHGVGSLASHTEIVFILSSPSHSFTEIFLNVPNKCKVSVAKCVPVEVRGLFSGSLGQHSEVENLL